MKKLAFIIGLPKSGKTVLGDLLSQNPNIRVEENSLYDEFSLIYYSTDNSKAEKIQKARDLFENVITPDSTIVLNDIRWSRFINEILFLFDDAIFISCMRDITEILSLYEREYINDPFSSTQNISSHLGVRNKHYYDTIIGIPYHQIFDAFVQGKLDNFVFVDYSSMCSMPLHTLKKVYTGIEQEYFKHNVEHLCYDFISPAEIIGVKEHALYCNHTYWEHL